MPTRLQPRLNELVQRKRADLARAVTHHREVLSGIAGTRERRSASLAQRRLALEVSCTEIERLYGELVFLSNVAGLKPPRRPSLD
jgi:hypothetical protein